MGESLGTIARNGPKRVGPSPVWLLLQNGQSGTKRNGLIRMVMELIGTVVERIRTVWNEYERLWNEWNGQE